MSKFTVVRELIAKRIQKDWYLTFGLFISLVFSITLAAMAPMYIGALENLGLRLVIENVERPRSNINVFSFNIPLTQNRLIGTEQVLDKAINENLSEIYEKRQRYLLADSYMAFLPRNPNSFGGSINDDSFTVDYRSLSEISEHVSFQKGRMATDQVNNTPKGVVLEAIVSENTANSFSLNVGDIIITTIEPNHPIRVTAQVVGIVTPTDSDESYWDPHPSLFLDPTPFNLDVSTGRDPNVNSYPAIPVFVTQAALINGLGNAYPTALIDSIWIIVFDKNDLKDWSLSQIQSRMKSFETSLARMNPGTEVAAFINVLINRFQKKLVFSRTPLFMLMMTMVGVLFIFIAILSTYIIKRRRADADILLANGFGAKLTFLIMVAEPFILILLSMIVAPAVAFYGVILMGNLPYLSVVSETVYLDPKLSGKIFLVVAVSGFIALFTISVSGIASSNHSILDHKFNLSRSFGRPWYQQYNLDLAFIALSAVVFWELRTSGHMISSGLFDGIKMDLVLMLTPVFFLVSSVFFVNRVFPLIFKFLTGESKLLLNLFTFIVIGIAGTIVNLDWLFDIEIDPLKPSLVLLLVGIIYLLKMFTNNWFYLIIGFIIEVALIYLFTTLLPIHSGWSNLSIAGLIALVPAEIFGLLVPKLIKNSPVWLTMGFLRISRNPMQYSGLIFILVLLSGVSVLAATVGLTLETNQKDRIKYSVGTAVRVSDAPLFAPNSLDSLKKGYSDIPGVTEVSLALRKQGNSGKIPIELLAVESIGFASMSWYRDDFSNLDFSTLMSALRFHDNVERIKIPDRSDSIGLWIKSSETIPGLVVYAVIQNEYGSLQTIFLGAPTEDQWTLLSGELPNFFQNNSHLISIQISEFGLGTSQTPGQILIDAIHVGRQGSSQISLLEDFEGQRRWFPIISSLLSVERITTTGRESYSGKRSGVFTFGKESYFGIRGFYQSTTAGPLPVIVSSVFAQNTLNTVGDVLVIELSGRLLPVVIRDVIDYFPTMDSLGASFIIADLESILGHLNIVSHLPRTSPNELFMSETPNAGTVVKSAIESIFRYSGKVYHRDSLLREIEFDPLTTPGWNSMTLLIIGMAIFSISIGVVVYGLTFYSKIADEIAVIKSLGLEWVHVIWMLIFEYFVILLIGLITGILIGTAMSNFIVGSVSFTETGQQAIPPFIMVTDWNILWFGFVAFVVVLFLITLVFTIKLMNLKVWQLMRIT